MVKIAIVDYRPEWREQFDRIAETLRSALGDRALRIDHIGSTSVAGLAAKDVLDIQVTVRDLDDAAIVARFREAGFRLREENSADLLVGLDDADSRELRKRFFREPHGEWRAHIHVREHGRTNQRYALVFRDYLRADPVVAQAYELVKRRLAEVIGNDRDAYCAIKDPVMDVIYQGALRWARSVGWVPDGEYR